MRKQIIQAARRPRHILAAATAAALFLVQPLNLAAAGGEVPETLDINIQTSCPDIPELSEDKKMVTGFSHKLHAEKYLPGKSAAAGMEYTDDFTCAACHSGAQSREELTGADRCQRLTEEVATWGGGKKYKNGMHGLCKDCHKNLEKAGQATGPTKCKECHTD